MKVFISNGHQVATKLEIKEFIAERNHDPVILGDQPGRQGLTIIEALEKFSEGCEFALILLTADDITLDGGQRARQNVVHEAGFLQGLLGRSKVVLIVEKGVEIPSNLSGLFYLEYHQGIKEIFTDLAKILGERDGSSAKKVTEPSVVDRILGVAEEFTSGDRLSKDLRWVYGELMSDIEHLPEKVAVNRITARLTEKVDEGRRFLRGHPAPEVSEVAGSKNPVGASIGNILVASVHSEGRKKHRILEELNEDLVVLRDQKGSLAEITSRMRKVLLVSEA